MLHVVHISCGNTEEGIDEIQIIDHLQEVETWTLDEHGQPKPEEFGEDRCIYESVRPSPDGYWCRQCNTEFGAAHLFVFDDAGLPAVPDDDEGCPVGDPDCYGPADGCHDACEAPKSMHTA